MSDRETLLLKETLGAIVEAAPASPELPALDNEVHGPMRLSVPVLVWVAAVVVVLVGIGGLVLAMQGPDLDVSATTTVSTPPTTAAPLSVEAEMVWERTLDSADLEGTVWALASTDNLVVAVGDDYNEDEGDNDTPNVVIWTSPDGRSWDRTYDPAVFGGEGIQQAFGVTAGPLGFIVAGEDVPNTVLWFSPDGANWERVFEDDLGTPGEVEGLRVVAGGPGWIATIDETQTEAAADAPILVSNDGRDWREAADSETEELLTILTDSQERQPKTPPPGDDWDFNWRYAWNGDQVVAMAYAWFDAMLWVSTDAGVTWTQIDSEAPAFDMWPRPWQLAITQFNGHTVVGGNGLWIGSTPTR